MRIHEEVARLAAHLPVAAKEPFALEPRSLEQLNGAFVGFERCGLHAQHVRLLVRPPRDELDDMRGDTSSPEVWRQVVRQLGASIEQHDRVKADGADQLIGHARGDREA